MPSLPKKRTGTAVSLLEIFQHTLDLLLVLIPVLWFTGLTTAQSLYSADPIATLFVQNIPDTFSDQMIGSVQQLLTSIEPTTSVPVTQLAGYTVPFLLACLAYLFVIFVSLAYAPLLWLLAKLTQQKNVTILVSFGIAVLATTWWLIARHVLATALTYYTQHQLTELGASTDWIDSLLQTVYNPLVSTICVLALASVVYVMKVHKLLVTKSIFETNPKLATVKK